MAEQAPSKVSGIKVGIVVIPALLIVSICIALYLGATEEEVPMKPVEGEVTVAELSDYLRKLNHVIEEPGFSSEAGMKGLRQASAMIQGTLGPENRGYEIFRSQTDSAGGLLWETIWINAGESSKGAPFVVAIPYGESGTPVAFALAFAEYLTSHPAKVPVRLVFYPPLPGDGELRSWILERSGGDSEISGMIAIKGDGPENHSASVNSTVSDLPLVTELLGKKGWEGNVLFEEVSFPQITLRLNEEGMTSRDIQAQRLIRLMPLLKGLIDELAN